MKTRRANRGEVWLVDCGSAAKAQAALLLTSYPSDDELDTVTVLFHTTELDGNSWELPLSKPFLEPGAFHLQQIQSVATVKLERRLGVLTEAELNRVFDGLAERLGL